MDSAERIKLWKQSKLNAKLESILERQEEFLPAINEEISKLPQAKPLTLLKENKGSEDVSSDMVVCVRVRPKLEHEIEAGVFQSVYAANPTVVALESSFDFRSKAKVSNSKFGVDMAFGTEDGNETIYEAVAAPLVDLALQGGTCCILAYGQTGSGKTYTISGVLDMMAKDIFTEGRENRFKFHACFFELLGNTVADLLNENAVIEVMEDKFGKVNAVGAVEVEVTSLEQFRELVEQATSHRKTEATFKNDTSSRSHAICKLRVQNKELKEVEDGCLYIIDLAGAENAVDSQFHDKERVKETKQINTSLMALKECIRNRALSALNPSQHYHVPYRQSKLTLLLKEAFELESMKQCRTVVFANVAPTLADSAMTLNTLRYAAPIKMGLKNRVRVVPDPKNPSNWSNERISEWVSKASKGAVDPKVLCPWESGRQLLRIPETEFVERVMKSNEKLGEKRAKEFYLQLWSKMMDARMVERKKVKKRAKKPDLDQKYGEEPKDVEDPGVRILFVTKKGAKINGGEIRKNVTLEEQQDAAALGPNSAIKQSQSDGVQSNEEKEK